jgi:hypothetical protein
VLDRAGDDAAMAIATGLMPSWIDCSGIDLVFLPFASVGDACPFVRP